MFALIRTDNSESPHKGLTFVLIDMDQAEIDVRPILQMDGRAEFSEVFFDGAAVSSDAVIGHPGEGWKVAMTMLGYERGMAHFGRYVRFAREVRTLLAYAASTSIGEKPALDVFGDRLMDAVVEIEVYRLSAYQLLAELIEGLPGSSASVIKLYWSETVQRLYALAVELMGELAIERSEESVDDWEQKYLASLARTLAGGTSEIQRNIIAERSLGLPR
jgi:alkylation response protein AidB-like acyl-CoA dehydrogenase